MITPGTKSSYPRPPQSLNPSEIISGRDILYVLPIHIFNHNVIVVQSTLIFSFYETILLIDNTPLRLVNIDLILNLTVKRGIVMTNIWIDGIVLWTRIHPAASRIFLGFTNSNPLATCCSLPQQAYDATNETF